MNHNSYKIQKEADGLTDRKELVYFSIYPGIDLKYVEVKSDFFSILHRPTEYILQINYCKSGQIAWKMENENFIYLNPGDFSLNTLNYYTDSSVNFPTGQYSGLTIYIDLQKNADNPPELLKETDIFNETLHNKFCQNNTISFFAGNDQTENIFSYFYNQPVNLTLPYQKLKVLELLIYLYKIDFRQQKQFTAYQSEMVDVIQKIHDQLIQKMEKRITIEELSKQYLINPTTLKTEFKAVYGASIAAHIKEHRMKRASEMLHESNMSIAEIAKAVGYDSQSKFTAAFKAFFHVLPKDYKKKL